MSELSVILSEEQASSLRSHIYSIAEKAVEDAKKDASLGKEFLRIGETAVWLGVSYNTLKKWEKSGLPVIQVDGVSFFSKSEVRKWLLLHQH